MSSFVAEYITVGELLQYNHSYAPLEGSRIEQNLIRLAEEFRAIREAWGGAIGIVGGYMPLIGSVIYLIIIMNGNIYFILLGFCSEYLLDINKNPTSFANISKSNGDIK